MELSEILLVIGAVLSSGTLSTIITVKANKRKLRVEVDAIQTSTVATLEPIVSAWLDRLKTRVEELETQVVSLTEQLRLETKKRQAYEAALVEAEIRVPDVQS